MKLSKNFKILLAVVFVAALCTLPFWGLSKFAMRLAVFSGIYILLATSLNFISGIAGQVSLGHAAFFGIGAYTSALLALKLNMDFSLCILAAGIVSALIGWLVALPAMRLSGGYLAIVTLGFGQIVYIVLLNWIDFTRGPMGLVGIPSPVYFGFKFREPKYYYFIVLALCIVVLLIFKNLINSRFGRNLRAIKDDEIAASAMGVNIYRNKVNCFAISSAVAGIAGSLYAHFMLFIDPSKFVGDESTAILSMVVLGGLGSMKGSIIAAILLTLLPELLRGFSRYRMLIYGILLVSVMLIRSVDWDKYKFTDRIRVFFKFANKPKDSQKGGR
ncbi:MAG: branched-chain amino acid ABC transporter permease [Oscillospiraceae bacterium]